MRWHSQVTMLPSVASRRPQMASHALKTPQRGSQKCGTCLLQTRAMATPLICITATRTNRHSSSSHRYSTVRSSMWFCCQQGECSARALSRPLSRAAAGKLSRLPLRNQVTRLKFVFRDSRMTCKVAHIHQPPVTGDRAVRCLV